MEDAYKAARDAAGEELERLITQRQEIDTRIQQLRQTIATLFRLTGGIVPEAFHNKGITDAVREYLEFCSQSGDAGVTVREVKDQLELVGYDFSRYRNALASINGTLQRLADAGELQKTTGTAPDGEKVTVYLIKKPEKQPEKAKAKEKK